MTTIDTITNPIGFFILGLLSSAHCAGMCGSIIAALSYGIQPQTQHNKRQKIFFLLIYSFGRIFSYSLAGILISLPGSFLLTNANHTGHLVLTVVSCFILIAIGLYIGGWLPQFNKIEKLGLPIWKFIEPKTKKCFPVKTAYQAFLLGILWGWLPCGIVYSVLLLNLNSGNLFLASLNMFSFGIGTLPAVFGLGLFTNVLLKSIQQKRIKILLGITIIIWAMLTLAISLIHSNQMNHDHSHQQTHLTNFRLSNIASAYQ